MRIECLVKREGVTSISLSNVKVPYIFQPIPWAKPGEFVTSYCEVSNADHIAYFLAHGRQYRQYDPDVSLKELQVDRMKAKKNIYAGYSVSKFHYMGKEGYAVYNKKDPSKTLYAGANTTEFVEKMADVMPWPTEFEAFEWLKNELEFETMGDDLQEPIELPDPERIESLERLNAEQARVIEELKAKLEGVSSDKKKPGRPPKLSSEDVDKVDSVIKQITGT